MRTQNKTHKIMLQTFGPIPTENEIFIPSEPVGLRNNCQIGAWTIGEEILGKKLSFVALSYKQYFGTLGKTRNTYWGELFLYPVNSENFPPCVLRTYLKSVGLKQFNTLIASTLARGKNPAKGYFHPEFKEKSGVNERGEPINYYIIGWDWYSWKEGNDDELFNKLSAAVSNYTFPPPNEGDLVLLPNDGKEREQTIYQFLATRGELPEQKLPPKNTKQLATAK